MSKKDRLPADEKVKIVEAYLSGTMGRIAIIVSHCIAGNKDYGNTIERYGVSYSQVCQSVSKYPRLNAVRRKDNHHAYRQRL